MKQYCLYIIIPCYNEEEVLPITAPLFLRKIKQLMDIGQIGNDSKIPFVNDGSTDGTWKIIESLAASDACFVGISQSRNRGHQSALLAGLMEAKDKCDITISCDCDGQDDIDAMNEMVECFTKGFDVVYGVRSNRESDSFLKRFTAESYYKFLKVMGIDVVYNHADYRLLFARILQEIAGFREVNLFLRGMIPFIGFPSTVVYYERHERLAGRSRYSLPKMLALAFDGITSFSIKPIRMITGLGLLVTILSLIGIIWALVCALTGVTVSGWASLVCIVCFFGGAILMTLGLLVSI